MASLVKFRKFVIPISSKNAGVFYNISRSKGYRHEDWMPGPYPRTEEERIQAAKKYGLQPEEYEPCSQHDYPLGDYPKLRDIERAAKDDYYPWDEPAHKRNYNEPLHRYCHNLGDDRVGVGLRPRYSDTFKLTALLGMITVLGVSTYIGSFYTSYPPVMEKQLPKPGVVHYTFQPAR